MPHPSPWMLGLAPGHNIGACLLHGAEIVAAIREERLLRMKRAEHPIFSAQLKFETAIKVA
jgi:predicted NodU family carbamoyl transferase